MRKHKLDRRQRKKRRKLIIFSMIGAVCFLSAGYAAFSSNFLLSGKGTIVVQKGTITMDKLKENIATIDDGLYADQIEENRFVYRGTDPDNYIKFNDELWRIIGIEEDNSLKIMSETNVGDAIAWDDDADPYWETASLNKYLNETYYNKLTDKAKNLMITHAFNTGKFYLKWEDEISATSLLQDVNYEKRETWEGNVGVLNVTDFVKSSLDTKCVSARSSWLSADDMPCINQNWLYKENQYYWTINANDPSNPNYIHNGWLIHNYVGSSGLDSKYSNDNSELRAYPVLFLNPNITLSGKGTKEEPYLINE